MVIITIKEEKGGPFEIVLRFGGIILDRTPAIQQWQSEPLAAAQILLYLSCVSGGKHPECSPDGCCINSSFATLLILPKFPYQELGCVCTSRCPTLSPWLAWPLLTLGHVLT